MKKKLYINKDLKYNKSILVIFFFTSMLILWYIYSNAAIGKPSPSLNITTKKLDKGHTYQIKVNNKIKNSTYSWSSNNKKIASVNKKTGLVKALQKGTATITCKITTSKKKTYTLKAKIVVSIPSNYNLVEELNSFNAELWWKRTGRNSVETFLSGFNPENVQFSNGNLELHFGADEKADTGVSGAEYQSTKEYGYGLFEVSMKPSDISGTCSSFFTYNSAADEIDIEFVGKDTTHVEYTIWKKGIKQVTQSYDLGFDASKQFHKYGILYTPEDIIWYVDGKETFRYENSLETKMTYILMNAWIGNPATCEQWLGKYNGENGYAGYEWIRYKKFTSFDEMEKMAKIK